MSMHHHMSIVVTELRANMWVLGTEARLPGRAAIVLNQQATFPIPCLSFMRQDLITSG